MFRFALLPLLALAASPALSSPALAAPADGPSRIFEGKDIFGLEVAADPQISPDGATVAYVRKSNDIMTDRARSTIWLVDVRVNSALARAAVLGIACWMRHSSQYAAVCSIRRI